MDWATLCALQRLLPLLKQRKDTRQANNKASGKSDDTSPLMQLLALARQETDAVELTAEEADAVPGQSQTLPLDLCCCWRLGHYPVLSQVSAQCCDCALDSVSLPSHLPEHCPVHKHSCQCSTKLVIICFKGSKMLMHASVEQIAVGLCFMESAALDVMHCHVLYHYCCVLLMCC